MYEKWPHFQEERRKKLAENALKMPLKNLTRIFDSFSKLFLKTAVFTEAVNGTWLLSGAGENRDIF